MITEKIAEILGYPKGYLLHENFQVKCSGIQDSDGNSQDRHLICTLDSHLPGADTHAIGNSEFQDSLWILDQAQTAIDWSNPVCQICSKPIAP